MKTLAIIGSAGRGPDSSKLSSELYERMVTDASDLVSRIGVSSLVSGGAAFADHVAVSLFLMNRVDTLKLYLPARFERGAFVEDSRFPGNPGRTANMYHKSFRKSCSVDGLAELAEAIENGAIIEVHPGFKRRNLEVAATASHMLAFTFGRGPSGDFTPSDPGFRSHSDAGLADGGTAHTWGECWKAEWKRHVNLYEHLEALNEARRADHPHTAF